MWVQPNQPGAYLKDAIRILVGLFKEADFALAISLGSVISGEVAPFIRKDACSEAVNDFRCQQLTVCSTTTHT